MDIKPSHCNTILCFFLYLVIVVAFPVAGLSAEGDGSKRYAVIFDAGSSGSRVHVFCFGQQLQLLHIGNDFELFVQTKPGLSAYASDPQLAANSLLPLLEEAESVIPTELRPYTPVRVGATAGLRLLGVETANKILQAVRDVIVEKSTLKYRADWVSVLDGFQEGSFLWVTINYLLGNLGQKYSGSVGTIDLGGGSIQMAYAISKKDAAKAPNSPTGEEPYVKELFLNGTKYYLYVHSYLNYGLLAARAEILKAAKSSYSYCVLGGYNGTYKYGNNVYEVKSTSSGPSFSKCKTDITKALKIDKACNYSKCTFDGVWNGGGGDGQKNLYVASFFFDIAVAAGFVDSGAETVEVRPVDFLAAANQACKMNIIVANTTYPFAQKDDLPFICMDLVYEYTLLVNGFGLNPRQKFTLVKKVQYGDSFVGAAWPLGCAIDVLSSTDAKFDQSSL